MLVKQKVQLLFQILQPEQAPLIIEKMIQHSPDKISTFWECLNKGPRMTIWSYLSPETKLKLLFGNDKNALDESQSKRLWDNIGSDNRRDLWEFMDELEDEIQKKK